MKRKKKVMQAFWIKDGNSYELRVGSTHILLDTINRQLDGTWYFESGRGSFPYLLEAKEAVEKFYGVRTIL